MLTEPETEGVSSDCSEGVVGTLNAIRQMVKEGKL
jgi:hypothetical protein